MVYGYVSLKNCKDAYSTESLHVVKKLVASIRSSIRLTTLLLLKLCLIRSRELDYAYTSLVSASYSTSTISYHVIAYK
jgi:hypothetical protein